MPARLLQLARVSDLQSKATFGRRQEDREETDPQLEKESLTVWLWLFGLPFRFLWILLSEPIRAPKETS